MKDLTIYYLKLAFVKICLLGVFFVLIPSDAMAQCAVYTGGYENPGPKYPDHPTRFGRYFYVGHEKEAIFEGASYCGVSGQFAASSNLKKLQAQINDTYAKFPGCEDERDCNRNYESPAWTSFYSDSSDAASECGEGFSKNYKYGRFYYCADGNMMERTDFIPINGCAPNTYAATDNCQPCPSGKYSPKGSTNISQCVDAKANEAVWAISKADINGFFSCPKGANMNGSGNCSCSKGKKWKPKKNQCV